MIEFRNVRKTYNGHAALNDVTLRVEPGELCVLLGPSGCGKTTLLRTVNRLVEPDAGQVLVEGRDVAGEDPVQLRRRIGYAIQSVGLFPHRTVAENIATTPELLGTSRERIAARVDEMLAMMKLEPARYRDRYPAQLSGGEAQRIGVARALAADPPILLMDEPFGAIDPINRAGIRDQFLELQRTLRKTILFVSHDINEALILADRLVLLREGRIEQADRPGTLVAAPATDFVRQFIGGDPRMLLLETLRVTDALATGNTSPSNGREHISETSSMKDALLMMIEHNLASVDITGANGEHRGTVTLDALKAHVARALAGDGNGTGEREGAA